MNNCKYLFAAVLVFGAAWLPASSYANDNSIRGGFFVNPDGNILLVEYERMVADKFSLGARLATVDYDYDDGSYEEEGDGSGVEFVAKFFPQGEGFKGFYVGGGIGYWNTEWDWVDPLDAPSFGKGESDTLNVNINLGWRILLGTEAVYLDPSFIIGNFIALSTDSTNNDDEAEFGLYAGVGLSLGVTF